MMNRKIAYALGTGIICAAIASHNVIAAPKQAVAKTHSVYVPVYSEIYYGDRERTFKLTVTLSIHNIDPVRAITIESVSFYDTAGMLLSEQLKGGRVLKPLETMHLVIKESDNEGGTGANFLVKWHATNIANAPLIESVMIGTAGQQGISFTSRGVPIID
jgi:hypothetical protein